MKIARPVLTPEQMARVSFADISVDGVSVKASHETLRAQVEELAAALAWAEIQLRALVTDDEGSGSFIRGRGVEIGGFGAGMDKIRAALAEIKANG